MKNLGEVGDKETETEVLLLEHDVPHQPFSQAVLSFLPKMPWSITEKVSRKEFLVTLSITISERILFDFSVLKYVETIVPFFPAFN